MEFSGHSDPAVHFPPDPVCATPASGFEMFTPVKLTTDNQSSLLILFMTFTAIFQALFNDLYVCNVLT